MELYKEELGGLNERLQDGMGMLQGKRDKKQYSNLMVKPLGLRQLGKTVKDIG